MIKFIKKNCCWTMPIISVILFTITIYLFNVNDVIEDLSSESQSTIIGIAGTLIGFLFTAMTVFLSLPKDNDIMKRVKRSNHHKIFGECVLIGIALLIICILFWMCNVPSSWIVMIFIEGLVETLIAAYYVYKLCIYNF